jgi:hypothetical protein
MREGVTLKVQMIADAAYRTDDSEGHSVSDKFTAASLAALE